MGSRRSKIYQTPSIYIFSPTFIVILYLPVADGGARNDGGHDPDVEGHDCEHQEVRDDRLHEVQRGEIEVAKPPANGLCFVNMSEKTFAVHHTTAHNLVISAF